MRFISSHRIIPCGRKENSATANFPLLFLHQPTHADCEPAITEYTKKCGCENVHSWAAKKKLKINLLKQQKAPALINKCQWCLWRRCDCVSVESDGNTGWKMGWLFMRLTFLMPVRLPWPVRFYPTPAQLCGMLIIVSGPSWFDWTHFVSTKHFEICCQRRTALRLSVQEITINTSVALLAFQNFSKTLFFFFLPLNWVRSSYQSKFYLTMMATRW